MSLLRSTGVLFVAALAGCSTVSEPVGSPAAANQDVSDSGMLIQVQGAGSVNLSAAGADNAEFQFVAMRRSDGQVLGHFRQTRTRPTGLVDFEGDVTCVTVDPNFPGRARIGGVITANNSTDPAFLTINNEVGDDVWFRVIDGGNGPGAVDMSTTYGFKPTLVDTSEQYCALPFDGLPWWNPASIFPLERGTILLQ